MVLQVAGGRMVGRDGELGHLLGLLDEAEAGRAVVALVSGDAGVGKTRLTSETVRFATSRGFTVLSGQCAELGDSVPYLPLADALRSAAQNPGTGVRDALESRPALSRLLPDGGERSTEADRNTLAMQQMFGGVLGLLAELAAAKPVLLVLEDLHWADGSTRDLLTFLSRMLHRERVALIGTYRSDDLHRRHPLRPVIAELLRLPSVISVDLGPLEASAMAEHLTSVAQGMLEQGQLDAAELNDIVARAGGNAYYAEELLAASDRHLPAGLAALLLNRVEQLSDNAQRVLRTAAVAGRRADDELVQAASGLAPAGYEDAVREAVAHQLLVSDGADGYSFRHALLREAVYADLLPGERTRLHAAMSTLLSDERQLAVPGTAAELARHCQASHDNQGAFAASMKAGQEAEDLGGFAEAHQHYDQALALWDRVSDPERTAGVSRGKLALQSALAAASSGDVVHAVHQLRRLHKLLLQDRERAGKKLIVRVAERLAYYLMALDDPKAEYESIDVARAAVEECLDDPPTWHRARAIATYANTMLLEDDDSIAKDWAERAREAARAAGAPWVEADALVTLGFLRNRHGRNDEAIELFTAAHQQAREAKVLGVELRAAYHLARAYLERGDLRLGATVAHEGVLRASHTGLSLAPYGLDLQHLHFQCHFADGYWNHAQEIADGFAIRATTNGEAYLSAMALFIDVARGNPAVEERQAWLEPFWSMPGFDAFIARGMLAEQALWNGDTVRAVQEVEAAIAVVADPGTEAEKYGPWVIRPAAIGIAALADRAIGVRAAGDEAAAREAEAAARVLLEQARGGGRYARRPGFIMGPEGRGWLARAEAEFLRLAGRNEPSAWAAVIDAFGPGYVYEVARARWRLAEAHAEAGERDLATGQWQRAVRTADKLGARPLRRALDDLARRARIGETVHHRDADLLLTSREREVLRLIAAGRSNREIASVLFISPKTASVHVSNILGKLGAASRTEAAAIAHRDGLVS